MATNEQTSALDTAPEDYLLAPVTEAATYTKPDIGPDPGALGGMDEQINAPGPANVYGDTASALEGTLGAGEKSQYISPEATVQGQLDQILSRNDADKPEYVRLAEAKAAEQANRQGMLSTTMAIGAARKGVIETSLEVAKPDAAMFGQSDIEKQRAIQASGAMAQQGEEERATSRQVFAQSVAQDKIRAHENLKALTVKGEIDFGTQQLGIAAEDRRAELKLRTDIDIANANISSDERTALWANETERQLRHSADITDILTNKDLDPAGRAAALARIDQLAVDDTNWALNAAGAEIFVDGQSTVSTRPATTQLADQTTVTGDPLDTTGLADNAVMPVGGTNVTDLQTGEVSTGFDSVTGEETFLEPLTGIQLAEKGIAQDLAQGTPYVALAQQSYTDFGAFEADLINSGTYESDEYFNFTNREVLIGHSPYYASGQGINPEDPEILTRPVYATKAQLEEAYKTILYAALNPENAEAQTLAQKANTGGVNTRPYNSFMGRTSGNVTPVPILQPIDPNTLPPSQRGEVTVVQDWINKYT